MTMLFRAVINVDECFLFLKGTELLQLILQSVLVALVVQEYPYAFAVALVQTSLNCLLITARIYYCFVRLHISIQFHGWAWDLLGDFRQLALSLFVISIIDQVFFRTNHVILGIIDGTNTVAVYSIAAIVYMNYMSLSTMISGVYLQHVTAMIVRKAPMAEISALFIQIGRGQYFFLLLVLARFVILDQQFISVWAGPDFLPRLLDDAVDYHSICH